MSLSSCLDCQDRSCSSCLQKEAQRIRSARWRAQHPGEGAKRSKEYREKYPERAAESSRKYREAHLDQWTEAQRRYKELNREKELERHRRYQQQRHQTPQGKEASRDGSRRRRARLRGAEVEPIVAREIFERDGWICQLCQMPVNESAVERRDLPSIDHIVPLSLGGNHTADNVQLAHVSCNSRKSNRV